MNCIGTVKNIIHFLDNLRHEALKELQEKIYILNSNLLWMKKHMALSRFVDMFNAI